MKPWFSSSLYGPRVQQNLLMFMQHEEAAPDGFALSIFSSVLPTSPEASVMAYTLVDSLCFTILDCVVTPFCDNHTNADFHHKYMTHTTESYRLIRSNFEDLQYTNTNT